jgi:hypothetical protein
MRKPNLFETPIRLGTLKLPRAVVGASADHLDGKTVDSEKKPFVTT